MKRGVAAVCAAFAFAACSWLVNPEAEEPRCSKDAGHDPCTKGTVCVDGRCRPQVCLEREICGDQIDNDCDGEVDEQTDALEMCNHADDDCDGEIDEDHDRDNDGHTWCGDLVHIESADCDDLNADVKPGGKEICDNLDNDCNGLDDDVPPGESLCEAADEICLDGRCIVPSCAIERSGVTCSSDKSCVLGKCELKHCNETQCASGNYCDAGSGSCVPLPTQRKNGESCSTAADCKSRLCMDAAAMRLDHSPARVCGEACCNDLDCDESGEICFASGTGARSCLPPSMVSTGMERQCSHGSDCPNAQRCAVGLLLSSSEARPSFGTTLCRTPGADDRDFGESCSSSDSCASRLCVPSPFSIFGVCSAPCRTSDDCSGLDKGEGFPITRAALGAPEQYCRVVELEQLAGLLYADDYAAACVMGYQTAGQKKLGEACATGRECAGGVCVVTTDNQGYCAPPCCADAQCETMAGGRAGARCAPLARGGHYEMRCMP